MRNDFLIQDTYIFTVKGLGHFTDVESAKWYSVSVAKAADNGYIYGIIGSILFMHQPEKPPRVLS